MLHEPYAWAEISYRRERLLSEAGRHADHPRAVEQAGKVTP